MTDDLISEMSDDRISALDYDEPQERQPARRPIEPTRLRPQPVRSNVRQYDTPQYYTEADKSVPTSRFRNNAMPSNVPGDNIPQGGYYAAPPAPQNIVIQQAPPAAVPRSGARKNPISSVRSRSTAAGRVFKFVHLRQEAVECRYFLRYDPARSPGETYGRKLPRRARGY